jgi:hypothetical protein
VTPTPEPVPECGDRIDNDGDGFIDMGYVNLPLGIDVLADPQCTSVFDTSESI